jgi:hypothetical protein
MARRSKEGKGLEAAAKLILLLLGMIALGTGSMATFPARFIGLVGAFLGFGALIAIAYFILCRLTRRAEAAVTPLAPVPVAEIAWSLPRVEAALGEIDWYQFEKFCAALLAVEGCDVERKGGAQPDGGVDVLVTKEGERQLVQCKHWRTWVVQEKTVREMLGSMTHFQVRSGAIYTLKGWTRPAAAFAAEHGIALVDASDLAYRGLKRLEVDQLNALLQPRDHHCPKCESVMVWRTGNFSPFWGCSRYPQGRGKLNHSGAR